MKSSAEDILKGYTFKLSEMYIRGMLEEDIETVLSMERAAFGTMAYHARDFLSAISGAYDFPFALMGKTEDPEHAGILGYAVVRLLGPEAELQTITVRETMRGQGLGKILMAEVLRLSREHGASRIFLEVREHNTAAKALYESFGFCPQYKRKNYYRDPAEDAVVMQKGIEC